MTNNESPKTNYTDRLNNVEQSINDTTDDLQLAKSDLEKLKKDSNEYSIKKSQIDDLEKKLKSLEIERKKIEEETGKKLDEEKQSTKKGDWIKTEKQSRNKDSSWAIEKAKELMSWNVNYELVKVCIENLETVSKDKQAFILWSVFNWINRRWISIDKIEWNKITLWIWSQPIYEDLDIAKREELNKYQSLINTHKLPNDLITKALFYRTSMLSQFIDEAWKNQKMMSKTDYVKRLMPERWINIVWWDLENSTFIDKNWKKNEKKYKEIRAFLNANLKDKQADKEFLMNYFDELYNEWRAWINENDMKSYLNDYPKVEKSFIDSINSFDLPENIKNALWLRNSDAIQDKIRQWSHDPIWALRNALDEWWFASIIVWLIWSIFFWKSWFFTWFLWTMWLSELWTNWIKDAFKKWKDLVEGSTEKTNTLEKKYEWLFEKDIWKMKKEELNEILKRLFNEDKFLDSDADNLEIFSKTPDEIEKYFESIWLVLTDKNKPYYKEIFKSLLEKRKASWINSPKKWEKISSYLLKNSNDLKTDDKKSDTKAEDKKTEIKTTSKALEKLNEADIKNKEIVLKLLKTDKYWFLTVWSFEKLDDNWLLAVFKHYKHEEFFNENKDAIKKVIQVIIANEPNKTANLKQILNNNK